MLPTPQAAWYGSRILPLTKINMHTQLDYRVIQPCASAPEAEVNCTSFYISDSASLPTTIYNWLRGLVRTHHDQSTNLTSWQNETFSDLNRPQTSSQLAHSPHAFIIHTSKEGHSSIHWWLSTSTPEDICRVLSHTPLGLWEISRHHGSYPIP